MYQDVSGWRETIKTDKKSTWIETNQAASRLIGMDQDRLAHIKMDQNGSKWIFQFSIDQPLFLSKHQRGILKTKSIPKYPPKYSKFDFSPG